MAKKNTARKETVRRRPVQNTVSLNDIINKVKENQEITDRKLLELSMMCSGKQCKVN